MVYLNIIKNRQVIPIIIIIINLCILPAVIIIIDYLIIQLSLICPWGMGIAEGSNLNLDTIPMISKGFRDFIKIPFVFFYVRFY